MMSIDKSVNNFLEKGLFLTYNTKTRKTCTAHSVRVASDSSRFFTLKTTQFLNGKNRKAACDFGSAPYFCKNCFICTHLGEVIFY